MTESTGRVALVTGGGQGIGAAIAQRLAAGGAAVGIVDLNEAGAKSVAEEITSAGGTAVAVAADITDRDQVAAAVDRVAESLGGLHILVNNAGVTRDKMLFKMTDEDWSTVIDVHLRGAFLCSQRAQKHMVDSKFGRIINLSSVAARGNRGQANYSTVKAGLQGLTKTLAIELGPYGVTANAIAPGFIETAMTAATAERLGVSMEDFKAQVAKDLPVRRVGVPADVAELAAFLADETSGYLTGQVIYLDGGMGLG